jgi:NADP-dependent 3-hydroxy acid dehydrogenase YdfG
VAAHELPKELSVDSRFAIRSKVDVGDREFLANWVDATAVDLGAIDVVVTDVSALAMPENADNWRTSFDVDFMGTVGLATTAFSDLERSNAPAIVTISNVSAAKSTSPSALRNDESDHLPLHAGFGASTRRSKPSQPCQPVFRRRRLAVN